MGSTYSVKGEAEVMKQLMTGGSNVRFEAGKAISKVTNEAIQQARAAAPAKPAAIREKIIAYGYGRDTVIPTFKGIPKAYHDQIRAVIESNRNYNTPSTVIVNEYYIGRFFETGFGPESISVRSHARRSRGNKSWARGKMRRYFSVHKPQSYASMAKKLTDGFKGPTARSDAFKYAEKVYGVRTAKRMFNRKGGQVWVERYDRTHHVDRRPYFVSSMENVGSRMDAVMKAVISNAMRESSR